MMIIVVIVAIIAVCCMSSSAAAVMIYFSWDDVKKLFGVSPSPVPATVPPPSFDNTVTPPVPKTESPTPPAPKSTTPPANPVTNPGDFSLENIDYKPVGDFKADVLGTINALRAIRNVSEPRPQKPIVPLTWDPDLEAAACVHADINAKGHMHHPDVVMKGWEIIAWHDPVHMSGVFAWWNEHKLKPNTAYPNVPTAWHCDPGNRACSDTGHESGDLATGHYASLSHSDATRIGCCTSTAGTWAPLVCQGK